MHVYQECFAWVDAGISFREDNLDVLFVTIVSIWFCASLIKLIVQISLNHLLEVFILGCQLKQTHSYTGAPVCVKTILKAVTMALLVRELPSLESQSECLL